MNTQELLKVYYQGLAQNSGWESVLAEDFRFIGGDMTNRTPLVGREAYRRVIQRLSGRYTGLRMVKAFVDGDQAMVLVDYDWSFPGGVKVTGPVAEKWLVENGRLQELTIYFDTLSFDRLVKG